MQRFPEGDTLGVVFSFLSTFNLLQSIFRVCKAWNRVLCELPHSWGNELDLHWTNHDFYHSNFAWHRITVCLMCRVMCTYFLLYSTLTYILVTKWRTIVWHTSPRCHYSISTCKIVNKWLTSVWYTSGQCRCNILTYIVVSKWRTMAWQTSVQCHYNISIWIGVIELQT